jgi:ABC-2 type transport system permease protein
MSVASERAERLAQLPLRDVNPSYGQVKGFVEDMKAIWGRRQLLDLLVRREIKGRYKESVLGLLWSLIRPLVLLLVYYLVIGRFLGAERAMPNFTIYVFTGLTLWTLFSEIVGGGTGSILANGGIIKKTQLPREIFPLTATGAAFFSFFTQFVLLLIAGLLTGGIPITKWLLYIPLSVACMTFWGLGLAFVFSASNVYLRDTQYIVEVLMLILFWASPNLYSWKMVQLNFPEWLQQIYLCNPMTLAVMGMQKAIWGDPVVEPTPEAPNPASFFPPDMLPKLLVAVVAGLAFLVFAQRVFAKWQRNFAQEL